MSVQAAPDDIVVGSPDDLLRARLRHASIESLLQVLITLTHRVHQRHDAVADRVRLQREFVISEIKRRAGGDQ